MKKILKTYATGISMAVLLLASPVHAESEVRFGVRDVSTILGQSIAQELGWDRVNVRYAQAVAQGSKKRMSLATIERSEEWQNTGLVLDSINVDDALSRFNAQVVTDNGVILNINGRYEAMTEVPVLSYRFDRGGVIREDDLTWKAVPQRYLRNNTVQDIGSLIGMEVTRTIVPGKPVSKRDIAPQTMIEKGDMVTVLYSTSTMELKLKGLALEKGARGDIIRIRNTRSQKIMHGRIESSGLAQVNYAFQPAVIEKRNVAKKREIAAERNG